MHCFESRSTLTPSQYRETVQSIGQVVQDRFSHEHLLLSQALTNRGPLEYNNSYDKYDFANFISTFAHTFAKSVWCRVSRKESTPMYDLSSSEIDVPVKASVLGRNRSQGLFYPSVNRQLPISRSFGDFFFFFVTLDLAPFRARPSSVKRPVNENNSTLAAAGKRCKVVRSRRDTR